MDAQQWIDTLAPFDRWNERVLLALFALIGIPETYLDVGSGTGAMVNLARKLGVQALGVDQLPRPDKWLVAHDLREPLDLGCVFHLVTSIEVAEHIAPERAEVFCDTLARHVAPGGLLVFTAAHPGQGGEEHVDLQPATYWRRLLNNRGFGFDEVLSLRISSIWQSLQTPQYWLPANVQAFAR